MVDIQQTAEFREGRLPVTEDISLYYREYGVETGATPVICLHGYWRTSRDYEELAQHLAPGRRVITVDMRGRGRSSRAARPEDYHFDRLVDDVLKLMEAVAVRKAVFVGVALGAQIIMELAVRRPDVLLGAIFNDSAPESNPAAGARMVKFAGGDELTLEEARARVVAQYQEQFPRMGDAEYDRLVYRNYAKSETGGYIRDFDQRTNEDLARLKKERPTFWTEFEAIQAPIALIRGENSDYITPEIMERTLAANRNAKLYTIPDAGHPAMFWEAEVFAAVDELLAKVDGQA